MSRRIIGAVVRAVLRKNDYLHVHGLWNDPSTGHFIAFGQGFSSAVKGVGEGTDTHSMSVGEMVRAAERVKAVKEAPRRVPRPARAVRRPAVAAQRRANLQGAVQHGGQLNSAAERRLVRAAEAARGPKPPRHDLPAHIPPKDAFTAFDKHPPGTDRFHSWVPKTKSGDAGEHFATGGTVWDAPSTNLADVLYGAINNPERFKTEVGSPRFTGVRSENGVNNVGRGTWIVTDHTNGDQFVLKEAGVFGHEPVREVIAAEVFNQLGIPSPAVKYADDPLVPRESPHALVMQFATQSLPGKIVKAATVHDSTVQQWVDVAMTDMLIDNPDRHSSNVIWIIPEGGSHPIPFPIDNGASFHRLGSGGSIVKSKVYDYGRSSPEASRRVMDAIENFRMRLRRQEAVKLLSTTAHDLQGMNKGGAGGLDPKAGDALVLALDTLDKFIKKMADEQYRQEIARNLGVKSAVRLGNG